MSIARTFLPLLLLAVTGPLAHAQMVGDRGQGYALMQRADSLFKDGSRDQALNALAQVHPNDTMFERALLARMYLMKEGTDLAGAERLCREGIKIDGTYSDDFIKELPGILMEQERYADAERAADSAITELPGNFRVRWLKAKALKLKGDVNAALRLAMDNAQRFPYHQDAHTMLAEMAWAEGHLSEAALALAMGQMVGANTSNAEAMLVAYDTWLGGSREHTSKGYDMSITGDELGDIDQLLQSQVAMSSKYKVKPDLDFPTCRQSHLLFNEIAKRPAGATGFYERFYGPLVKAIVKDHRFEGFVYHCIAASSNEKVHAIAEKNKAKAQEFEKWLYTTMRGLYQDFPETEGGPVMTHLYFDDKNMRSIGNIDRSTNSGVGAWTVFNAAGRVAARGTFDAAGKRTGRWTNWAITGTIESEADYVNDEVDGAYISYFNNGNMDDSIAMRAGKRQGPLRHYYRGGGVRATKDAVDGALHGPVKEYFPTGAVEWEYNLTQEVIEGPVTQYYADGSKRETGRFLKGAPDGALIDLHPNGKQEVEQSFALGKPDGPFKRWYPDGTLAEEGARKAGEHTGERRFYDAWGMLSRVERYGEGGRMQGTYEEFADNGQRVLIMEMNKGLLMKYAYYDRTGKLLGEGQRTKGRFQLKGYEADGSLAAEGVYLDEGAKEGSWKYYHPDGTLRSEEEYRKGERVGAYRAYGKSGKLERTIVDYTRNGITYTATTDHYRNGNVKEEGRSRDGKTEGVVRRYYPDGTVRKVEYYENDEQQGWQQFHDALGRLEYAERYDAGAIAERVSYDEEGREYERIVVPKGPFELVTHYPTGEVYSRLNMINGWLHGKATWYYPNGKASSEGMYLNGDRHGTWKGYHVDGSRSTENEYTMGELTGTSRKWYANGTLQLETPYSFNKKHGVQREYHENGKPMFVREYAHGEEHGKVISYCHDGTPQMERYYLKGRLWAYGSPTADGSVKDTIRLNGGRMDLETHFANGRLSRKMSYRNNEIDGEFVEYHSNGQVMERTPYDTGEQTGTTKEYHPNGQLMLMEPYVNGEVHGERIVYWDNGQVRERADYVQGTLYGTRTLFDRSGKKLVTYHMRNDDVMRIAK